MPSPLGHSLAGLAIALAGNRESASTTFKELLVRPATVLCVALAALPDADLLIPGFHRRATHSLGATIIVTILAIVVTEQVNRRGVGTRDSGLGGIAWRVVALCAAAHASHILMDWLGADLSQPAGIQALWPWTDRWFISGWDLFPQIDRRQIFSAASIVTNVNAFVWELLLMGPVAMLAWRLRAGRSR